MYNPTMLKQGILLAGLILISGLVLASLGCDFIDPGRVKISGAEFFAGRNGPRRRPPIYSITEPIFCRIKVRGFKLQNNVLWLEEDLKIRKAKGEILAWTDAEGFEHQFDFPHLLDQNQKLEGLIKTAPIENTIALPAGTPGGKYLLEVTIRDRVGGTSDTRSFPFLLKSSPLEYPKKFRLPWFGQPK